MRVIVHPRQGGKTRDLIQMSAIMGVPIMTFRNRIPFIENFARERLRLLIPKPIAYPNLSSLLCDGAPRLRCPEAVLLDDAGEYLQSLLHCQGFDPIAMAFNQDGDPMRPIEEFCEVDICE